MLQITKLNFYIWGYLFSHVHLTSASNSFLRYWPLRNPVIWSLETALCATKCEQVFCKPWDLWCHLYKMSKISLIFHKFHQFRKYLCTFFKKIMFNLSKITLTAACFGKIFPENEQTTAWKIDRQTDSLERTGNGNFIWFFVCWPQKLSWCVF